MHKLYTDKSSQQGEMYTLLVTSKLQVGFWSFTQNVNLITINS